MILPLLCALGATTLGCGPEESTLRCGDGTEEQDGACVAANTDTDALGTSSGASEGPGAGLTEPGPATGDDGSPGGKSDDDPDPERPTPYAACPGGSDVECLAFEGEQCNDLLGMCTTGCSQDTDCSTPPDGTAVQRCERTGSWSGICVIYCGVEGFTCPSGMVCQEASLCEPDEGGTSGGWGTTGGGCENPTLDICVWG